MPENFFSYGVENEFIDSKETVISINYCGSKIGEAFFYLDEVYIHFTENQPVIPSNEWKFLGGILDKIKSQKERFCPVS